MKFKTDFLRDELDLPYSAVEDEIIDNSRWSIHHAIIFEHDGKFYRTYYSVGATECQIAINDGSDWVDIKIGKGLWLILSREQVLALREKLKEVN